MSESTRIYHVTGMTCGHCITAVTQEVSALPGVTGVHVEIATGEVTVASTRVLTDAAGHPRCGEPATAASLPGTHAPQGACNARHPSRDLTDTSLDIGGLPALLVGACRSMGRVEGLHRSRSTCHRDAQVSYEPRHRHFRALASAVAKSGTPRARLPGRLAPTTRGGA